MRKFVLGLLLALGVALPAHAQQSISATSITATKQFVASGAHLDEADAGNIASASTTDICAMAGDSATITGTTTITAFDTCQAGVTRKLRFSGIVTVTYNSASLILPNAASYTTAAGDVLWFTSKGSGNWYLSAYALASGQAIVGSGLTLSGSSGYFQTNNGSGNLGSLSPTAATAALNAMVGDSGSGVTKGLVPSASTGGATTEFLRKDGTFSTPAGSGGNFTGPGSSVTGNCVSFGDTSGTLGADSGVHCGPAIGASMSLAGTQSLTSGTLTAVSFDTKDYDTGSFVNIGSHPTRITIATAGIYDFYASIPIHGGISGGQYFACAVKLNGTTFVASASWATTGAADNIVACNGQWKFSASDYIEVYVQEGDGSTTIGPGGGFVFPTVPPRFQISGAGGS